MEKKILILLILLIIVQSTYAATIKDTLEPKESVVIRDKNITLISTTDESIKVCVNGELAIVGQSSRTVNGVFINILSSSKKEARLELSYSCPNCICDESCDNTICLNECETDLDCIDGNRSTIDKCIDTPKICVHEPTKLGEKEQTEEVVIPIPPKQDIQLNAPIQQIQQVNEKEETLIKEISQKQDMLITTTIIVAIIIVILILIVLFKKR